jgi:hypothetical protein
MEANRYVLARIYQEMLNEDKILYREEDQWYNLETIVVDNQLMNESIERDLFRNDLKMSHVVLTGQML